MASQTTNHSSLEDIAKCILDSCLCFPGFLDRYCVVKTLKTYVPAYSIVCWGCFENQPNQLAHDCLMRDHLNCDSPDQCETCQDWKVDAVRDYFRNPENTTHLLEHYLRSHPEFTKHSEVSKHEFYSILQDLEKDLLRQLVKAIHGNELNHGWDINQDELYH